MTQASLDLTRRSRAENWLLAFVLIAATLLAYRPAWNGGFIWDDDYYLTKNPLLTAPDGLRRIWFSLDSPSQYFPLVYTMFRFERALWGLNPAGYHAVNIALHIANALLVWRLLFRLRIPGAWFAAAIFALHPLQVESVAWITERKNVLMGFFFLLTLIAWIGFLDRDNSRRRIFYWLALCAYVLALFAKSTACTLPVALILILWWRHQPIDRRRVAQIIPFLLCAIAMALVAIWWERYHQGTRGPLFVLGPLERLLVASHAVWFYLGKLFWPNDLAFSYPRWNLANPLAYVWTVGSFATAALLFFARGRLGRGVVMAALFFVATLAPMLGFVMLYTFRYTFVADHYQYLACIGPIALVAAGLTKSLPPSRSYFFASRALVLVPLAALTWHQSESYRDIETLWRTTIARNPACWMAYTNLSVALLERGQVDAAIENCRKSLQLYPDYAEAHYNLGNALLKKGNAPEALAECRTALALNPNDLDSHVALANALVATGQINEAIEHYQRALQLNPEDSTALYNFGHLLLEKGDSARAIAHLKKATQIDPQLSDAHIDLGNAALLENREREAADHYRAALRVAPQSLLALNNLALLLASSRDESVRDGAQAVKLAEAANRLSPAPNAIVLHTLAAAYAQDRQFSEAIETARRAIEIANEEKQTGLRDELEQEIKLYEAGSPLGR